MHHFVFKRPEGSNIIDHINQDKLDNRKENLRETTRSGNRNNISKTNAPTSSQYKGVNFQKHTSCYRSRFGDLLLYYGENEQQAGRMYDIYTFQKFGEHANNNRLISYEDAMKYEWKKKETIERTLPKHISMMRNLFRVKKHFRNTKYCFYFKTLEKAKEKLDELNFQCNHILLMEELHYMFSEIRRNEQQIAYIPYKGKEILVSDEDYFFLNKKRWYISDTGYAFNNDLKTMHRLLLSCEDDKMVINHKNGNRIDNRRDNLEIVSASVNAHNRTVKMSNTSSEYVGVTFHKQTQKWVAQLKKNHRKYYIGVYDNENDAAKAYNQKAIELYGNDANLNVIVD